MIFDYAGDMVITLPVSIKASEQNPFCCMVVNTLGRIDFNTIDPLIAYAPHVEKSVTCSLMRGMINWYGLGTNNKVELG